jgi:preprotein translocase subunit YajC
MSAFFRFALLCAVVGVAFAASSIDESALQQATQAGDQAPPPGPSGMDWFLPAIMGAMLLMIVLSFRGQRKEKQKRQEMINELAVGSKVATIGGISGTVTRLGDDTIDLKTGESTIEVSRGAVNRVLNEGDKVPDPHDRN